MITPERKKYLERYQRSYGKIHRAELSLKARDYYRNNKERAKQLNNEKRNVVLSHYSKSDSPFCAICGEASRELLTIDHIENNGAAHRKIIGKIGLAKYLLSHGLPGGYQVLCWNCQLKKLVTMRRENRKTTGKSIHAAKVREELKCQVMLHYSNGTCQCSNCATKDIDILTIEHINNNGAEERRKYSNGLAGSPFYKWLRKEKYPKGYSVLCMNCNYLSYRKCA